MRGPITMDPAGDKVNGERARRCGTSLCHRVRGPRSRRYWLFPPRRLSGAFRPFTGPIGNVRKGSTAGFRGATFETSWRLSKPLDFRPKIAVANILSSAHRKAARPIVDVSEAG